MKTGKFLLWLSSVSLMLAFAACTKDETPDGDENNDKDPVEETAKAEASFTYEVDGLTVKFTNTSKNAVKYSWDFGDDESSTEQNPEHTYFAGGTYEVELRATAEDGTYDTSSQEITVSSPATAVFTYTAGFGSLINFDARASENVDAATASWNFGDGSEPETGSLEVSHEFPGDGTYTVVLSIKDASGNDVEPYSAEITVKGDYNLLKGSGMEAEDAQYWKVTYVFNTDPAVEMEWQFGYTQDKPKDGHNGCYALLPWDYFFQNASTRFFLYQGVEVEEGRTYKLSAAVKTGGYEGSGVALRFYVMPHDEEFIDEDGHPMFKGAGAPSKEFTTSIDHWGNGVNPETGVSVGNDAATPTDEIMTFEYTATQTGILYVAFDAYWLECRLDAPWLLDDFKFELMPEGPEETPAE